jgi:hypothetical protein
MVAIVVYGTQPAGSNVNCDSQLIKVKFFAPITKENENEYSKVTYLFSQSLISVLPFLDSDLISSFLD